MAKSGNTKLNETAADASAAAKAAPATAAKGPAPAEAIVWPQDIEKVEAKLAEFVCGVRTLSAMQAYAAMALLRRRGSAQPLPGAPKPEEKPQPVAFEWELPEV